MALNLPMATVIGYSSVGNFFGDDIARWRTIQTVTIEGVMDPTNVNSMVDALSTASSASPSDDPTSSNAYLGHSISVNDVAVNNSKLISLDFPASDGSSTEFHDEKAKYIATYEVYIAPSNNTILGIAFNDLKSLEEFSEDISFEITEDNTYSCTWSMNVRFATSPASGGGGTTDGIVAAKTLWSTITGSTPPSIPIGNTVYGTTLSSSISDIWNLGGRWYETEIFNTRTGDCNFSRKRTFLSQSYIANNAAESTHNYKHSISFDENGIMTITETGDVTGLVDTGTYTLSPEMDAAVDATAVLINAAYANCSSLWAVWHNVLGTPSSYSVLHSQYKEKSIGYDEQAGKTTYMVSFTDDPTFKDAPNGIFESRITKGQESSDGGEFVIFSEEGEIKSFRSVSGNYTGYQSVYDSLRTYTEIGGADSAYRIVALFGTEAGSGGLLHPHVKQVSRRINYKNNAHILDGNLGISRLSFVTKFAGDASLSPFGVSTGNQYTTVRNSNNEQIRIIKLTRKLETSGGVTKKEWFNPPNNPIGCEFVHVGNDIADISTRKVIYNGQIERNRHGGPVSYIPYVKKVVAYLEPFLKADALSVFTEYLLVPNQKYWDKYYYSDFSWSFKSNNEFTVSIEMKYVVPIGALTAGWPAAHSDNTQIIV